MRKRQGCWWDRVSSALGLAAREGLKGVSGVVSLTVASGLRDHEQEWMWATLVWHPG